MKKPLASAVVKTVFQTPFKVFVPLLFLLLAWPVVFKAQEIFPLTEAPAPSPPPPSASSRIPNTHPTNLWPRWRPFVNLDPLLMLGVNGEPQAIHSTLSGASVVVNSKQITHIVANQPGVGVVHLQNASGDLRNNGFSSPTLIAPIAPETVVSNIELVASSNDNFYAFWSASEPPYETEDAYLQANINGSWSPPIKLTESVFALKDCDGVLITDYGQKYGRPSAAVDALGNIFILIPFEQVYSFECYPDLIVFGGLQYIKLGSDLSILFEDEVVFDELGLISEVQIALDPNSTAHAVWESRSHATGESAIYYGAELDFWLPIPLAGGANQQSPGLFIDSADNAHFAWTEDPEQASSRVVYQKKTSAGLSAPETVSTGPGKSPKIGGDKQDRPNIAWIDSASGLLAYALRSGRTDIGPDPWVGRQEPSPVAQTAGINLMALDMSMDTKDGLVIVATDLTNNQTLHTQTHDYNLGLQDPNTQQVVAPNTVVNLVNGNVFFSLPLFSTDGAGFSTDLSITYNSLDQRPCPWIFNYELCLIDSGTGYKDQTGPAEDVMTLFAGDGASIVFRYHASLGYHIADAEFGHFSRLERKGDPATPTYELTGKHGTVYRFNNKGKLVEAEDRNGNTQTFEYINGKLFKITDSVGRETIIIHSADGKEVTITDPAGQQYILTFDDQKKLLSVEFKGAPADDLVIWGLGYHDKDEAVTIDDVPDVFSHKGSLGKVQTPKGMQEDFSWILHYLPDGRFRAMMQPEAAYKEEDGTTVNDKATIVVSYLDEKPGETPVTMVRNRRGFNFSVAANRKQNLAESVTDEEGYTSTFEHNEYRCVTQMTDKSGTITQREFYDPAETQPPFIGDNVKTDSRQNDDGTMYTAAMYTYTDDGFNLLETIKDCADAVTVMAYNALTLNLESITHPETSLPDGTTETLTETFAYNDQGTMIECTDQRGNVTTCAAIDPATGLSTEWHFPETSTNALITFDIMGNVASSTEPGGGTTTIIRDGLYRVKEVVQPATEAGEHRITLEHDANSNVIKAYDNLLGPDDPFFQAYFDVLDRLVEVKNAKEQSATAQYDRNDNAVSTQDFRGVVNAAFFGARDQVREDVRDCASPIDNQALLTRNTYEFDCCLDCTQVSCIGSDPADTQVTTFAFDARHNPVGVNHAEDNIADAATFDCNDLVTACVRGVMENGTITPFNETTLEYDEIYRLTTVNQSLLGNAGLLKSANMNSVLTTHFIYKNGGARQIVQDPLGFQSTILENGRYLPTDLLRHNQGVLTRQSFNDRDLPTETKIVNPLNGSLSTVATNTYNNRNQLTAQTDPFNNSTTYKYDLRGRLIETTDEAGFKTQLVYNELDQLEGVTRATGTADESKILSEFDAHGNETLRTVWNPATQTYDARYEMLYDNADRLVKMTFPSIPGQSGASLFRTWTYDEFGNLAAYTDRNGKTTNYEYDKMNRLRVEIHHNPNNSDHDRRLEYTYDPPGNLILLLERAGTTAASPQVFREENAYDALNRLITQSWFLDGTAQAYQEMNFAYDDASRLIACTDGEGVAYEFSYNEDHWLIGLAAPDGTFVQYDYDDGGRRTDAWLGLPALGDTQNARAHIQYDYDEEVRLTGIETNGGGRLLNRILCQYDERDNRRNIGYEHLNASVDFNYDGLNRLASEDWTVSAECNDFLADLPGGAETAATDFFPAAPASGFPSTVRTYTGNYTFDPAGNRTTKIINSETTTYAYNAQNQLTEAAPPNVDAINYQYDANGNQIQRSQGDRLESFTYDFYNRMIDYRREENGGLSTHYTYRLTPMGQRYAKQDQQAVQSEWFKYIGRDVYGDYEQSSATGEWKLKTLYQNGLSIDSKLARIDVAEDGSFTGKNWYLPDPLGSAHQMIDNDANIANLQLTDAWGVAMPEDFLTLAREVQDRYQGLAQREVDEESGLQYTRARHYDAESGRFLAVDPLLGNVIGEHFGYAAGNPVMMRDPMGLDPDSFDPDYIYQNNLRRAEEIRLTARSCMDCHGQPLEIRALIGMADQMPRFNTGSLPHVETKEIGDFMLKYALPTIGAAGSAGEVALGTAALPKSFGTSAVLIVHGLDGFQANIRSFGQDQVVRTFTSRGLESLAKPVMSDESAFWVGTLGDAFIGIAGSLRAGRLLQNAKNPILDSSSQTLVRVRSPVPEEYLAELDNLVYDFARRISEGGRRFRRELNFPNGNRPPIVIGAILPNGAAVIDTAGDLPTVIAPQLRHLMNISGGAGLQRGGNTLGRCAEFRAANRLLLANPKFNIDDIVFSTPYRPRSIPQPRPRCINCCSLFGWE